MADYRDDTWPPEQNLGFLATPNMQDIKDLRREIQELKDKMARMREEIEALEWRTRG